MNKSVKTLIVFKIASSNFNTLSTSSSDRSGRFTDFLSFVHLKLVISKPMERIILQSFLSHLKDNLNLYNFCLILLLKNAYFL